MKLWVTKDGKEIPYNQLAIPHILRIIDYAKRKGFYTKHISHSIVDNTDTCVIIKDCSSEVIKDMYEELNRRHHETSKTS